MARETLKVRESTYWSLKPWRSQELLSIYFGVREKLVGIMPWKVSLILCSRGVSRRQLNTYDGAYLEIYITAFKWLGSNASVIMLCNRESKR